MKQKLLYPLVLVTVSLATGLPLAAPLVPARAVMTEHAGADTSGSGSSPMGLPAGRHLLEPADEMVYLQEIRERAKRQAARATFELATLSAEENDQGRAAELLRDAVALQPDNTDYLLAASRTAFTLKDYKYAEACLVKVLSTYRGTVVEDGTKLVVALDNLAVLYRIQGKTTEATSALNEALAVKTALYGEHHPGVVHNLYRLAELDLISANYGEAKNHLKRAMTILDASPSPIEDQDGAALLHNIGELYRVSGEYTEAESAYAKAMALWNKSPATNQRGIAMTQEGLDRLRAKRGATSSLAGLEGEPQVENAPPVSALLPEPTQAHM